MPFSPEFPNDIPINEADIEDKIDALLETVPTELRTRWESDIWNEHAKPKDALSRLEALINGRKNALGHTRHHPASELTEHAQREQMSEEALTIARSIIERSDNIIGTGGTGRVHTSTQYLGTCYKYIFNTGKEYTNHNDVFEEERITDLASSLVVNKVRCPKTLFVFSEGNTSVLVLEELRAISLKRAIALPSLLPEGFDIDTFFADLEAYIHALHTRYRVHHRDLHADNIMIDTDSGHAYVIDFGRAVSDILDDEDPYVMVDAQGNTVGKYLNDVQQIGLHKNALRNAIAQIQHS